MHPSDKASIVRQLELLGVERGDTVMVHASLRAVGPLANGPVTLVEAILERVGPEGNLMALVSWNESPYEETLGHEVVPEEVRERWPAFDPETAPSYPGYGALNEFIRTYPGARRSAHPDSSMVAIGRDAEWLVWPHEMGSAYGPGSPIERFLKLGGKVLSIGAGEDAVTVLHFAEALADIPGKRRVTYSMPLLHSGTREWISASDWDSNGILDEYAVEEKPDAVERIARDYLALGVHKEGLVGRARTRLIDANAIVGFGIAWLEQRHRRAL
ncbi:aminoglycoside 3-N-acetyltransferase [Massilia endophytica]|uniref:aminoglycoside 3-N-acetyltransferase n=1 Tax=Massilia endophytica TaxID=2899220 RepID=UPI001E311FFA|nr:aminoglycoside 3-N-acetyltransferase [Massilia endophytica]UGQ45522.1 aminoglycoside 3-N-acetyltransferase [Massilia endophytica]